MANTDKLSLPLIESNMTADVPRDMNALAEAVDARVGVAGGLAVLGADGKVPADQLNVKDPVDASLTQKGIVQLSNAISDTSQIKAVTPYALKTVYDLAVAGMRLRNINNGTNLDTLTQTGLYRIVDKVNFPNSPDSYGVLQVNADTPGYVTQDFIAILSAKRYTRARTETGTWTTWKEAFTTDGGYINGDVTITGPEKALILKNPNGSATGIRLQAGGDGRFYIQKANAATGAGDGNLVWINGTDGNLYWPGGDLNSLKQSVVDGKSAVASAINGKGGSASGSNTFAELAAAITNLPVKRFASGTFNGQTASGTNPNDGVSINLAVNGLAFSPSRVFIRARFSDTADFTRQVDAIVMADSTNANNIIAYGWRGNYISFGDFFRQVTGGFTLALRTSKIDQYAGSSSDLPKIMVYQWWAYE
ncbi:pyocin knob domain-containing protein [Paenibacillus polymyxa]|uniref:pyocin knob domain-containing protein n=1 Tax=Paenibacillus polymyxa TaxID=1406 RepID=UPI0021E40FBD|nr:pyocin knob domain-containing protein [Paenibacillus polymyxa]